MNMNALADEALKELTAIHPQSYRNKAPQTPVWPYLVFQLDTVLPMSPSLDAYLDISIFDKPDVSARTIETLADDVYEALENKVLYTSGLNAHVVLEQRQFVSNTDLIEAQMVNLRFVVRTYFKE